MALLFVSPPQTHLGDIHRGCDSTTQAAAPAASCTSSSRTEHARQFFEMQGRLCHASWKLEQKLWQCASPNCNIPGEPCWFRDPWRQMTVLGKLSLIGGDGTEQEAITCKRHQRVSGRMPRHPLESEPNRKQP